MASVKRNRNSAEERTGTIFTGALTLLLYYYSLTSFPYTFLCSSLSGYSFFDYRVSFHQRWGENEVNVARAWDKRL